MRDENLISWNFPNFISIALMLAIIWVLLGAAGHIFIRAPARAAGKGKTSGVNASAVPASAGNAAAAQ